jgi:two-component system response regulator RegX3
VQIPTVLVVEDDEAFVEALEIALRREGFHVRTARDGTSALTVFDDVLPDIVLLDIVLPGMSGLDVCREIRVTSNVPIVMVTARETELDLVVGLEVGADDYMVKPYRLRELVARVRAVLRRSPEDGRTDDEGLEKVDAIEIDGVRLDVARHEVVVHDRLVHLPRKEFELLAVLMRKAGRVVTRETLMATTWGAGYYGSTKTLDVHVKRVRAKIEDDPAKPARITTIRGLGYRYEAVTGSTRHASTG